MLLFAFLLFESVEHGAGGLIDACLCNFLLDNLLFCLLPSFDDFSFDDGTFCHNSLFIMYSLLYHHSNTQFSLFFPHFLSSPLFIHFALSSHCDAGILQVDVQCAAGRHFRWSQTR